MAQNELKNVNITSNDINLTSLKTGRVIYSKNISRGDTLKIELDNSLIIKNIEMILWEKKQGEDWKVITTSKKGYVFYKPNSDTADLQIDLKSTITENEVKSFWLGTFQVTDYSQYNDLPNNFRVQAQVNSINKNNIFMQWITIFIVFLLGLFINFCFKEHLGIVITCLLGLVSGVTLYGLSSVLLLILGIPFTLVSVSGCALGVMILILVKKYKFLSLNKREAVLLAISVFSFMLLLTVFVKLNFAVTTYDSYYYVNFGKAIAYYKGFIPDMAYPIRSFGLFMPLLHSLAMFGRYDFSYAIHPLLSLNFLIIFYVCLYEEIIKVGNNKVNSAIIALLGTLVIGGSYFWIFQSVLMLNNLITSIFLSLAVIFAWRALTKGNQIWFKFSFYFMLVFLFSRVENPLCGLLFFAAMFMLNIPYDLVRNYFTLYSVAAILWYSKVFTITGIGGQGDFLTINKAIAILVLYALLLLFLFKQSSLAMKLKPYIGMLLILMLLIISGVLTIIKMNHAYLNLKVMIENMFMYGSWGYTWVIVLMMVILTVVMNEFPESKYFLTCIIGYFLVMFILFMFRPQPVRLGFGDSANRMLIHILPVLVFYLFSKFGNQFSQHQGGRR